MQHILQILLYYYAVYYIIVYIKRSQFIVSYNLKTYPWLYDCTFYWLCIL